MQKQRVVITGMGAVTSLGENLEAFWEGIKAGRSGVKNIQRLDTSRHHVHFAGEISDFKPEQYIDRKEAKRMDRFTQFAVVAADEAMRDSGLQITEENRYRVGVVLGVGVGGLEVWEKEFTKLLNQGPDRVSPFLIPMMIANMASGHISIRTGARGPNTSMVSACASSGHAIGLAFDWIARGDADAVICGGAEAPITQIGLAGFGNMHALSRRNDDPSRASRPFDKTRDGFVMGEGAGVLVLESLQSAKQRGAKIHAEVLGWGDAGDSYHITGMPEDGSGIGNAMQLALNHSDLKPKDVGYINAHGTSTPTNDGTETLGIKKVFGDHAYKLAVSSTKSQIGHLLGASSAVEAIATVKGLEEQILPPTINYEFPDPECDLDYVPNASRPADFDVALSNSSGFGGHNVSLAFKRWKE
jgi:3-oxoacyl-[acyl-carrier-protein] synthase II